MSSSTVPSRRNGVQYLYMLAAFIIIIAGIRTAEPILNPLLLAIFLSVICAPAYLRLLKRGVSQWLSLVIVSGSLSAATMILVAILMSSIADFTGHQEYFQTKAREKETAFRNQIREWFPESSTDEEADSDETAAEDSSETGFTGGHDDGPPGTADRKSDNNSFTTLLYNQFDVSTALSLAFQVAGSLSKLLSKVLLIMLMVVFILLEVGTFEQKLKQAFSRRQDTTEQATQMIRNVQRYMAIKTAMSVATALLISLWLRLFNVPYISLWVLLAFLLNFIPNVGSIAAAIPAVLIAWLDANLYVAGGVIIGYMIVNFAIGNFLEPRLMGRRLGLSPLVIFCSMVFWGWVLGPVGMLLSVPLTMTLHIVLNGFDDTRWIATLMGTGTAAAK